MTTLNPTANNWLLPTRDDAIIDNLRRALGYDKPHSQVVREQGLQVTIGWTKAETFNELNATWWESHFDQYQYGYLLALANNLGIKPAGRAPSRVALIKMLSDHYRARFQ